ncbi:hypothetical protein D3C86_2088750 [compost metagenome]
MMSTAWTISSIPPNWPPKRRQQLLLKLELQTLLPPGKLRLRTPLPPPGKLRLRTPLLPPGKQLLMAR